MRTPLRIIVTVMNLALITLLETPPAGAALSELYPTGGPAGITTLRLGFLGTLTAGAPSRPANGKFNLLNRGWMEVWLTPASPVPQATVSARSVEYPILIDYVQGFTQNVPKDIRDKIYLDVTVISKPPEYVFSPLYRTAP